MTVQADLCRTWSETLKTGFLASRLIFDHVQHNCHTIPYKANCTHYLIDEVLCWPGISDKFSSEFIVLGQKIRNIDILCLL